MKKFYSFICAITLIIGVVSHANASNLFDMGDGTIYDTDTQLTWLKDAGMGGSRVWWESINRTGAFQWVEDLVFAGFDNWRLPFAEPNPEGPNVNTYNMLGSEMGHLYYTELENPPALGGPNSPLNPGPFDNLEQYGYWSSGEGAGGSSAWVFNFSGGAQGTAQIYEMYFYTWAVRDGARTASPVPIPGPLYLFGSGLIGLAGIKKKLKT